MKRIRMGVSCGLFVWAVTGRAEPALTVYNQNFAVVRETFPMVVQKGINRLEFSDLSAHVNPESVILRDLSGKIHLQVLEQNYRSNPISQGLLLSLNEGRTIEFLKRTGETERVVQGKIVRSGYVPHRAAYQRYGQQYAMQQQAMAYGGGTGAPIIEVDGKLMFQLPGTPLFPSLTDDSILKPTLHWVIEADRAGKLEAELCYLTDGMSWSADYNVVAPPAGNTVSLVGWVTMDNQCGKTFKNARIKLMAGDVSKIKAAQERARTRGYMGFGIGGGGMTPPVAEKTFDEYHLYTVKRRTTLRDRETKQIEFVRANGIATQRVYVYDGAKIDRNRYRGYSPESIRQNRDYGTQCNHKVWVMREFANTAKNGLGVPLPMGTIRFYRRDEDGQLEFTGENLIGHTPKDETVRVYTGNAFDLVGERKRTQFKIDRNGNWLDEAFEIVLRNHKADAVRVRVVEHLYRWENWEITEKSNTFIKTDARTIEFRFQMKPDEQITVTYLVHYTW